jgi:hypothetical protein
MTRQWAAFALSVLSTLGLAIAMNVTSARQDAEVAALRARVDEQGRQLAEVQQVARASQRMAAIQQAVLAGPPAPQILGGNGPGGTLGPVASPEQVQQFLTEAHLGAAAWKAVQAVNERWRAETWKLSPELVSATPEEAARRLDEVEARRVKALRGLLDPTQLAAYEAFRHQAGAWGQVMCCNSTVLRLLPLY